ncbi:hypothetical protein GEK68_17560 [Salmonella enterica]|nr:hypothetical protein [Salmonella enterica]EDI8729103.1 hypothetical protein [Salmonella enterica]
MLFTSGFACLMTASPSLIIRCCCPSVSCRHLKPRLSVASSRYLPGGYRIDGLPAQLSDVLKAVKHAEA